MSYRMLGVVAAGAALVAVIVAAVVAIMGDSGPTKDEPDAYTKAIVQTAIDRYESDGRQATIDYYNTSESVDGQWYVFIVGSDGVTIAHHNEKFRGRDPSLRIDAAG